MSENKFVIVGFKTEEDAKRYYNRLSVHIKGIASKRHTSYDENLKQQLSKTQFENMELNKFIARFNEEFFLNNSGTGLMKLYRDIQEYRMERNND